MSIEKLRDMRRLGQRPVRVVVIIGNPNKRLELGSRSDVVIVNRADMDLSPLVGLPVHVMDIAGERDATLRVLAQLEGVKASFLGICGPAGSCGVSPEHEIAMQRYREVLCPTE